MNKNGKSEMILEAALNAFSKKGYHDTRMENIAKDAGVGKGTLYEYFSNKEELFKESLEYAINIYLEKINMAVQEGKSVEEKIIGILKFECGTKKKYDNFAFTFMRESANIEMDFKKSIYRIREIKIQLYSKIISNAVDEGIYRDDLDVDLAASILLGALNQVQFKNFYHGLNDFSIDDTKNTLKILNHGFKKKQFS
ncbi:MAG TPA: TetR/AcrR family transcriptional regulator [Clostridia bacterium]|nr:TetR/AcrR family transcriptional regulator [Clostridia bacterium]